MERYKRIFKENSDGEQVLKKLGFSFKKSDIQKTFKLKSTDQLIQNLYTNNPDDPHKENTIILLIGHIDVVKKGRNPDGSGFGNVVSIVKDLKAKSLSKEDLDAIGFYFRSNVK